jgi:hypothetical protein
MLGAREEPTRDSPALVTGDGIVGRRRELEELRGWLDAARHGNRSPRCAVAEATEAQFAGDLSEHLTEIARHWAELAPYGEAANARTWAIRAADDALRRLAYEEGVRLYRAALALDGTSLLHDDRCRLLIALGRAACVG